jgi:putative sigma-54 modulation protein
MQVLVTFRHMEATDALRRYAEQKVARVHKLMRRPVEAHVVLSVNKKRHHAEITLSGEHLHVNAMEETGDLYSAIDLAMDKIERQIRKHVTKRRGHKHVVVPAPTAAASTAPARPARAPRLSTERVLVEPMTVREAMRRIARDGTEVMLFHNEVTDALTVLYRRKDGAYALIEPEVAKG